MSFRNLILIFILTVAIITSCASPPPPSPAPAWEFGERTTGKGRFVLSDYNVRILGDRKAQVSGILSECSYEVEKYQFIPGRANSKRRITTRWVPFYPERVLVQTIYGKVTAIVEPSHQFEAVIETPALEHVFRDVLEFDEIL